MRNMIGQLLKNKSLRTTMVTVAQALEQQKKDLF